MNFKPPIVGTLYRDEITPKINLCLRETGLPIYQYAINFIADKHILDSYYFKTLEEAKDFYDTKVMELTQIFKDWEI